MSENKFIESSDLKIDIDITFKEVLFGGKRIIKVKRKEQCDSCNGSGVTISNENCSICNGIGRIKKNIITSFGKMTTQTICVQCNGTGKVIKEKCQICEGRGDVIRSKEIKLNLPRKIKKGQMILLKGEGNFLGNVLGKGNLYVRVQNIKFRA